MVFNTLLCCRKGWSRGLGKGEKQQVKQGKKATQQPSIPDCTTRLPGVPGRPLRAASGRFKISRETHHCLTSVSPSTKLQLEVAHGSIYCATFLVMLELLGKVALSLLKILSRWDINLGSIPDNGAKAEERRAKRDMRDISGTVVQAPVSAMSEVFPFQHHEPL